jgi:hypothetical protein
VYIIQRSLEYLGNGGEPMQPSEEIGFLITILPAEWFGNLFSWWLREGHHGGNAGAEDF